jgi:hypothetical protein
MEKHILLERLKIRKPPTEFQDACLKTFCAARATLELGGFQCWKSYTQAICCVEGFSLWELAFVPPFSGLLLFMHASFNYMGSTGPNLTRYFWSGSTTKDWIHLFMFVCHVLSGCYRDNIKIDASLCVETAKQCVTPGIYQRWGCWMRGPWELHQHWP